ncbi:MAG: calcium-binding protein, partial [Microcoleus sp.]
KEGRFGTTFFESDYLKQNPDIVPFVKSGTFTTGREHYAKYGQFEPNRSATFVGTSGNDIVTGFGAGNVEIIGVEVGVEPIYGMARLYESNGSNEFDTLTGGIGNNKFVLGDYQQLARIMSPGVQLYIGPGFATIVNFTKGKDSIQLVGSLDGYILFPINNNQDLAIQTKGFDTVAVIQGGGNLSLNQLSGYGFGNFLLT